MPRNASNPDDCLVLELPNVAADPRHNYEIRITDLANALSEAILSHQLDTEASLALGEEGNNGSDSGLVVWHTHPGGQVGPSDADLASRLDSIRYLVVDLPPEESLRPTPCFF